MIEIPLTKGYKAVIDDEDYELVSQYKWYYHTHGYAATSKWNKELKKTETILMHRLVMNAQKGEEIDHRNRDGNRLRNIKSNLRRCTRADNTHNTRIPKTNSTGYKGIRLCRGRYQAIIGINGGYKHLGSFGDPIEAARAYDKAAVEHYGEFAYLNFPKEV